MTYNDNGYKNAKFSDSDNKISSISYFTTLVLARWAGVVRFIQRLNEDKKAEDFERFTLM